MGISFSADLRACTVIGPEGQKVRILFGKPNAGRWGKTRLRLHEAGPMHLKEAFLGGAKKNVIVTLVPEGWLPSTDETDDADENTIAQEPAGNRGGTRIVSKTKDIGGLRDEFRSLLLKWLNQNGPLSTDQLYDLARKERPDLCDDEAVCDCREAGDVVWQHQLRWAQQDLKEHGKIKLDGRQWVSV